MGDACRSRGTNRPPIATAAAPSSATDPTGRNPAKPVSASSQTTASADANGTRSPRAQAPAAHDASNASAIESASRPHDMTLPVRATTRPATQANTPATTSIAAGVVRVVDVIRHPFAVGARC